MCSQTLFACRDFPVPMTSPRAAERRSRAELHGFPIASHHMACHGSVWHSRVLHFSAQFLLMPQRIATKENAARLGAKVEDTLHLFICRDLGEGQNGRHRCVI